MGLSWQRTVSPRLVYNSAASEVHLSQRVPLIMGPAFRQHAGGHTEGPNWPTFLDFASRYWEPK